MRKTLTGKWLAGIAGTALGLLVFVGTPVTSMAYTQAVGIVSSDTARVRKEPTTDSDAVTGLAKGSTVTITDEVTDSGGATWYKVSVDGAAGYIRSDLLIKGTASTSTGTTAIVPTETAAQTAPEPTTATPIAETKAYVNYESARVRQGASTNHDIVGSALKNTPVTITGEAKASDGKLWYQIKYTSSGGSEIVGFVRSDLVTVGEPPAQEEPAPEPETPAEGEAVEENPDDAAAGTEAEAGTEEPETPAEGEAAPDVPEETKPDYEMVYRQNESTGEMEWYLFDNINGTMQTLQGLLDAADAGVKLSESNKKMLSAERIIIIVLAVVAAALAITVTLLLFKIKDLYGDDYDDDDEDDDDEDDDDDEEDDDEEDEDDEPVMRRGRRSLKAVSGKSSRSSSARRRKVEYDEEEDDEEEEDEEEEERRPVRTVSRTAAAPRAVAASKPQAGSAAASASKPSRKAKNFLIDDDEFEFEFLNMDDRD